MLMLAVLRSRRVGSKTRYYWTWSKIQKRTCEKTTILKVKKKIINK